MEEGREEQLQSRELLLCLQGYKIKKHKNSNIMI
jgi:hypothetical protein